MTSRTRVNCLARRTPVAGPPPRGFRALRPGERLRKLTPRARQAARRRLDPSYRRAVRVIAWQVARYGASPHDAEALAARFRQKEAR